MSWYKFCNDSELYNGLYKDAIEYSKQIFNEYNDKKNKIPLEPKPSHLQCKKCGSKKIWIDIRQVRSSDEGATTFCQCHDCKSKWTIN